MSFLALTLSLRHLPGDTLSSRRQSALPPPCQLYWNQEGPALLHTTSQEECMLHPSLTYALLSDEHNGLFLRVTTCDEAGLASLPQALHALTQQSFLHLGTHWYQGELVALSHSPWDGVSTWADFLAEPFSSTIRFHLGTPLLLPASPPDHVSCFPSAQTLLPTLFARWNDLGGPPLPTGLAPLLEEGCVVLSEYRLQTHHLVLAAEERTGFSGWMSYSCRRSASALRKTLTALARFAFFGGIGVCTQDGLGTTRVSFAS